MPDNLTRREFMKDMGLLGAGAGLAPIVGFGEDWSDKAAPPARPDWVKEVDEPTIEIDWDVMQRWDERNTTFNPKYYGEERLNKLRNIQSENTARYLAEGRPGYTLKDIALMQAARARAFANVSGAEYPFIGLQQTPTPEERGVPKYTGTPEEAAKIVAAAMRLFGAASVGFVKLEPGTTEKLIFSHDGDGKALEFADVDYPEETEDKRIIPNKARYCIVFTIAMSEETQTRAPTPTGAATTYVGYEQGGLTQTRTQEFLRGLGYVGVGESGRNALGIAPAFGVMAGLGELSRHNRLVTPEYGPTVRVFKMLTDLPVAPTKPIDAGIMEFCKRCKKCADLCPAKAISFDDEPTWEVTGEWNNPGHKAFFDDALKCRSYWYEVGTGCAICYTVCPYATKDKALLHAIRNRVAATTPVFDKTFKSLDDLLYTPVKELGRPQKDPETWWDLDLPQFGYDTTQAKRDG